MEKRDIYKNTYKNKVALYKSINNKIRDNLKKLFTYNWFPDILRRSLYKFQRFMCLFLTYKSQPILRDQCSITVQIDIKF